MSITENGWVIVNKSGRIQYRSFHRTRAETIKWWLEGSHRSWKYWYSRHGIRCVKATEVVSLQ